MLVLVDTNVLLRTAKPDDSDHAVALEALSHLTAHGHEPAFVPQSAFEYYVVATRPIAQNGLGLDPVDAIRDLDELLRLYRFMRGDGEVFEEWKELVKTHSVRGKTAHDARLVAAMRHHGISDLLTFNVSDFRRYEPNIQSHDPRNMTA